MTLSSIMPRLVEAASKIASGLLDPKEYRSPVAPRIAIEAVRNVGVRLQGVRDGLYYCVICGRGPFRRKGYYLHLIRVHGEEIAALLEEEIERLSTASRGLEG